MWPMLIATSILKSFLKMNNAKETAIYKLQFLGHHSYSRKDFQMLLAHLEGKI